VRGARTLLLVVLLGGGVAGGWASIAVVERVQRDAAALLKVQRLPGIDTLRSAPPGIAAFALANDARLVALVRRQVPDWIALVKPAGAGKFANRVGLLLAGGGLLHGDRRAVVGGLALLEGNLMVGLAVDGAKEAFGRVRPNHPGPGRWFAAGDSFPSSHAAHAFLLATVLGATFDDPGSQRALWGLASGVALQRLKEGVHYPTDVLAGGALGWWIGRGLATGRGLAAPGRPVGGAGTSPTQ